MSSDEEGAEYFDYEDEGFDDEDVESESTVAFDRP
jgi:hypothetical protein